MLLANAVFAGPCVSPSGDMTEAGILGPRASWIQCGCQTEGLSGPSTVKGQEEEDYDFTQQGTHATDRGRQREAAWRRQWLNCCFTSLAEGYVCVCVLQCKLVDKATGDCFVLFFQEKALKYEDLKESKKCQINRKSNDYIFCRRIKESFVTSLWMLSNVFSPFVSECDWKILEHFKWIERDHAAH